jgi:hypothetical protein
VGIYINECRNGERSRAVSSLGIYVSNFWYSAHPPLPTHIEMVFEMSFYTLENDGGKSLGNCLAAGQYEKVLLYGHLAPRIGHRKPVEKKLRLE